MRTHTKEYLTNYIGIFMMFCNVSLLCICWYINLILFVLLCFECSFVCIVLHGALHLLFKNEPKCGSKISSNQQITPHSFGFSVLQFYEKKKKTGFESQLKYFNDGKIKGENRSTWVSQNFWLTFVHNILKWAWVFFFHTVKWFQVLQCKSNSFT